MDLAHKSEFKCQLRAAGNNEDVIKELENMVNDINSGEMILDDVIDYIFDEFKLWKFVSVKRIMKGGERSGTKRSIGSSCE